MPKPFVDGTPGVPPGQPGPLIFRVARSNNSSNPPLVPAETRPLLFSRKFISNAPSYDT